MLWIYIHQVVQENDLTGKGPRRTLLPEECSVAFMKDILWNFSKSIDLVLDAFPTMLSIVKACLKQDNHIKIVNMRNIGTAWKGHGRACRSLWLSETNEPVCME